jgi:ribosome silencing factor RsfS/YbeB/iojap
LTTKTESKTSKRTASPRQAVSRASAELKASPRQRKAASSSVEKAPKAAQKPAKKVAAAVPAKAAAKPKAPKPSAAKPAKAVPIKSIDERVREAVVARLDSMKANDLKVIDVRGKTSVCDCIVIASGTSTRHVKSMGDEVVVTAKKLGFPPLGVEGEKEAEWILVDLGDTVVHVMLPRTREFYQLERMWGIVEEARAAAAGA